MPHMHARGPPARQMPTLGSTCAMSLRSAAPQFPAPPLPSAYACHKSSMGTQTFSQQWPTPHKPLCQTPTFGSSCSMHQSMRLTESSSPSVSRPSVALSACIPSISDGTHAQPHQHAPARPLPQPEAYFPNISQQQNNPQKQNNLAYFLFHLLYASVTASSSPPVPRPSLALSSTTGRRPAGKNRSSSSSATCREVRNREECEP